MRSERRFTTSDDVGFIHPYPRSYPLLIPVCRKTVSRSDDDMKSVKSMSSVFFFLSDFFCVRCATGVFYNKPSPSPARQNIRGHHIRNSRLPLAEAWVYIYSSGLGVSLIVASVENSLSHLRRDLNRSPNAVQNNKHKKNVSLFLCVCFVALPPTVLFLEHPPVSGIRRKP